ncbi:MAG: hypothetical protein KGJ23_03170 [Euryarchaeota archaeon]|nr:hypothetical protein [Euryarchaeota archaeon]MDE1835599.1 hypothetical protein [Euryarchaeota archaeon]MDE1878947.1 hypothetical protein [Euryarchaeota archaeon]MDE2043779.1 hypothetical protein [Thermoplasmata archaeon]
MQRTRTNYAEVATIALLGLVLLGLLTPGPLRSMVAQGAQGAAPTPVAVGALQAASAGAGQGAPYAVHGVSLHPLSVGASASVGTSRAPLASGASLAAEGPSASVPNAISLGSSWAGINAATGCACFPPDGAEGEGNGYVVQSVNLWYHVWTTGGTSQWSESASTFFGTSDGLSDPKVFYDNQTSRWFTSFLDVTNNHLWIAVSKTSTPTQGTSNWVISDLPGPSNGDLPDQPILGVDANNVVLSTNDFSSTAFDGAEVFVVNKTAVMGSAQTAWGWTWGPNNNYGSMHPAYHLDATNTMWFATTCGGAGTNCTWPIAVGKLTGSPPATPNFVVYNYWTWTNSSSQLPPAVGFQKGSTVKLDTGDDRVSSATWTNGVLWVAADDSCRASTGFASCLHLWSFSTSAGTPSKVQDFKWEDKANSFDGYPSVIIDKYGNVGVSFEEASNATFPSTYVTGQATSDPVNTLEAATLAKAGGGAITATQSNFCAGVITCARWGDYSGSSVDPTNRNQFWMEAEDGPGAGDSYWATWVQEFQFPYPSGTPTVNFALSPASGAGSISFNSVTYYNGGSTSIATGSYPLSATTNAGWHFSSWSTTGGLSVGASGLTVSSSGTLTATYTQYAKVTFAINRAACGPITFNSTTQANASSASYYTSSSPFTASIPACGGETFSSWAVTGGVSVGSPTALSTSVTLTDNGTLTANFVTGSVDVVTVAIAPGAGDGYVTLSGTPYFNGNTANLAAGSYPLAFAASPGWAFSTWSATGGLTIGAGTLAVSSSGTLTVTFVQDPTLSFTVSPTSCQPITFNGSTPWNSGTSGSFYTSGSPYTASVAACSGYSFSSWSTTGGVAAGSPSATSTPVTLTDNGTLTATFTASSGVTVSFTISPASPSSGGSVTLNGVTYYNGGSVSIATGTYTLSQTPAPAFRFSSWAFAGGVALSGGSLVVTGAGTVTANYVAVYGVAFSVAPAACAATSEVQFNGTNWANAGSGTFAGLTTSALAEHCNGYHFSSWTNSGGVTVSGSASNPTSTTLAGNGSLGATWAVNGTTTFSITLVASPASCGPISFNAGSYASGSSVTIAAGTYALSVGSCSGYSFSSWSATGSNVVALPSASSTSVTIASAGTLTATFSSATTYAVTVSTAPASCGSVTINGNTYTNGMTANLAATTYPITTSACSGYFLVPSFALTGGVSLNAAHTQLTVSNAGTLAMTFATTLTGQVSATPASTTTGSAVSFTLTLSGGLGPYVATWNFGDGSSWATTNLTSTSGTESHTFGSANTFTVTVTVRDSVGQVISGSVPIQVSSSSAAGSPIPLWALGLLLLVVVAAIVATVLLVRRRKKSQELLAGPNAAAGAAYEPVPFPSPAGGAPPPPPPTYGATMAPAPPPPVTSAPPPVATQAVAPMPAPAPLPPPAPVTPPRPSAAPRPGPYLTERQRRAQEAAAAAPATGSAATEPPPSTSTPSEGSGGATDGNSG